MNVNDCCQYLDWDSSFFGLRIARVTRRRLTSSSVVVILQWCQSNCIDCLYFLADADHAETTRLAEDNGFRFVDIRVTLERQLDNIPHSEAANGVIRPFESNDVPTLRAIAAVSHRDTRFYYDDGFSSEVCDALYARWIENSCNGYADAVLVAELDGRLSGYISCHRVDQAAGQIGLIAVSMDARGKGLGQRLVSASLRWFAERDMRRVTVVTQGRNSIAQRLYERCGFMTRSVQLWYHRWFIYKGANS